MNGHNPANQTRARYRRIMLKLSGEALSGPGGSGIDPDQAAFIARRVKAVYNLGVEIGVGIGAGNLWRGKDGVGQGRGPSTAGQRGMMTTVMNTLARRGA